MKAYFLEDVISGRGSIMEKNMIHNIGLDWGRKLVAEGKALELPNESMKDLYARKAHWDAVAEAHRNKDIVEDNSSFMDKFFNKENRE